MASRGKVKSLHPGTTTPRDGHFTVKVRLLETGEKFSVSGCGQLMKVGELKEKLELLAGIPQNLQTLSYLDDGDMPDNSTFKHNGIIPGGKLSLSVWPYDGVTDLIKFTATGDLAKLITVGVTPDSSFNTANSSRLNKKQKTEWLAARSGLALYIAAHRGHPHLVQFLLQNGCPESGELAAHVCLFHSLLWEFRVQLGTYAAIPPTVHKRCNVQYKTRLGNTPLHVAAARGNCDCVDELLANGAEAQDTNEEGHTALDVARLWGQKKVERRLFLYFWEKRTANVSVKTHLDPSELFAHQKYDSKLKTWRSGSYAKRYMANLVQFREFKGSHLSAPPKKTPVKKYAEKDKIMSRVGEEDGGLQLKTKTEKLDTTLQEKEQGIRYRLDGEKHVQ